MMVVGKEERDSTIRNKQSAKTKYVIFTHDRCELLFGHDCPAQQHAIELEQQYQRAMAFEIASLLLFSLFLAIFICFTVPLTGALVRLRANYNPKGLQLDPEDGVQPHTGPVITSFFVMLSRVRQLEVSDVPHKLFIDWPGSR
jgi:hypothetical protein